MFTYKGPVLGNGFLSYVELCGKVLASLETEGFWLDGVNPGAFALGARTLDETNVKLRETLTGILFDFAESAESFGMFKASVEAFYHETDSETVHEWEEAVKAVQQGRVPVPSNLARRPDWKCFIRVTEKSLSEIRPGDNPILPAAGPQPALAAAA